MMRPLTPPLSIKDDFIASTRRAVEEATDFAISEALPDGSWYGEFKSDATLTAEYVFLRLVLGLDMEEDKDKILLWLRSQQRPDGSWARAPDYPADVSTTSEAYLAMKILDVPMDDPAMRLARDFVIKSGGLSKVRMFTRLFYATFGLFPWSAVPQLPTELILMPSFVPINIYKFSSWARSFIIPLLIVCHHRPIFALPNGAYPNNDYLDELWPNPNDKSAPYVESLWNLWRLDWIAIAFSLLDYVLCFFGGLRYFPFRGYCIRRAMDWLLIHQEETGDWEVYMPIHHFSVLALLCEGYSPKSVRITRAIESLERFAWQDDGGKRVQASISDVWDTGLMISALCDAGLPRESPCLLKSTAWLRSFQHYGGRGDWRIYNPQLTPGGWSFSSYNTWYPDVDDTAAVLIAFAKQDPESVKAPSFLAGVEWVLGMQNPDGGWGAFDRNNDALFLNKIPFSDMDALCDPSWNDVTGRVLEMLGVILHSPYKGEIGRGILPRLKLASVKAIDFLAFSQHRTVGGWYGRWGSNYTYGTGIVLVGLSYFTASSQINMDGQSGYAPPKCNAMVNGFVVNRPDEQRDIEGNLCHDHHDFSSRLAQSLVPQAISFLKSRQNEDGGWGECLESYDDSSLAGVGPSTASQTGWVVMGLLAFLPPSDDAIRLGVEYLVRTQTPAPAPSPSSSPLSPPSSPATVAIPRNDQQVRFGATWKEEAFTGIGFPGFYFFAYGLYPHIFPLKALSRYLHAVDREMAALNATSIF